MPALPLLRKGRESGREEEEDPSSSENTSFATEPNLEDLRVKLRNFAHARKWERFHRPSNLMLALVGEVGELAECFQWRAPEDVAPGLSTWTEEEKEHLGEEMSDVLLYLTRLADVCSIDLPRAAERKILKNAIKYPLPAAVQPELRETVSQKSIAIPASDS